MNYKRRRKKNTIWKKTWKKISYFARKNVISLVVFFFIFIVFGFIIICYNIYIDTPEKTVKETLFSKEHIEYLVLDDVLEYTKSIFSGQNTLELKYFTFDSLKEDLLSKYYFLKDVSFQEQWASTVYVNFSLKKPIFVFSGVVEDYIVYNKENYFSLEKWNALFLSWNNIVNLAEFATWDIQWVFYKTSPETINEFIIGIREFIDIDADFTYIPWGEKLMIIIDNKKIYFDLQKSLDLQIENLFILKKQLELYQKAYMIDVSSLSSGVYLHILEEKSK